MALGTIRIKGTKLQMQQGDGTWYEWEGTLVGVSAKAVGTVWIHGDNLHYTDIAGNERYIYGPDGGLTSNPNKLWAGTPAVGVRYFAWIDYSLHSRTGHDNTPHVDHQDDTVHVNVPHVNTAHSNVHGDVAHYNVPHSDSHTDIHGDTPHTNWYWDETVIGDPHINQHYNIAHVNTHDNVPHSNSPYGDTAHVNTHTNIAHGDSHTNTPAYTDHDNTPHVNLPTLMP